MRWSQPCRIPSLTPSPTWKQAVKSALITDGPAAVNQQPVTGGPNACTAVAYGLKTSKLGAIPRKRDSAFPCLCYHTVTNRIEALFPSPGGRALCWPGSGRRGEVRNPHFASAGNRESAEKSRHMLCMACTACAYIAHHFICRQVASLIPPPADPQREAARYPLARAVLTCTTPRFR